MLIAIDLLVNLQLMFINVLLFNNRKALHHYKSKYLDLHKGCMLLK